MVTTTTYLSAPGCTSAGMYLDLGSESSVRINARTVLNDIFVFTERDGHFTVGRTVVSTGRHEF